MQAMWSWNVNLLELYLTQYLTLDNFFFSYILEPSPQHCLESRSFTILTLSITVELGDPQFSA